MDVRIKHIGSEDEENIILINMYSEDEKICNNNIRVDTKEKKIYNYKEFFTEIIEKSFINNVTYKISIENQESMNSDIEGITSLLKESIDIYNKIVTEDI